MNRIRVTHKACLGIFITILASVAAYNSAQAWTPIQQKAYGFGIYRCYTAGALEANIDNVRDDFQGYSNLFIGGEDVNVPLLTGNYGDTDSITCKELFGGKNEFGGLLALKNEDYTTNFSRWFRNPDSDVTLKKEILESMGYVTTGDSSERECFRFKFTKVDAGNSAIIGRRASSITEVYTDGICPQSDGTVEVDRSDGDGNFVSLNGGGNQISMLLQWYTIGGDNSATLHHPSAEYYDYDGDISTLRNSLRDAISSIFSSDGANVSGEDGISYRCVYGGGSTSASMQYCYQTGTTIVDIYSSSESSSASYTLGNSREASYRASAQLLDATITRPSDMQFTPEEEKELYTYYLERYYVVTRAAEPADGQELDEEELEANGFMHIESGDSNCWVVATMHTGEDDKVNALREDGYFDGSRRLSWQELVRKLGADVVCEIDVTEPSVNPITGETEDYCKDLDLAGQGWLLCTTMENMQYTASALDQIVENWLSVDTGIYDNESPTYVVWETMRNMANVIIIIILLLVIFSQLTGYGIDNYGIKKMLPRLIAMAILINLSFIICDIAVDLSNIIGVGLRDLFGSMGNSLNPDGIRGEEFISAMVTGIFGLVGIGGAAAGTIISAVAAGPMAVVVIILALVGIIAAVLLFFIMLGARMVIIIGCIAVAPIAFALYILPNTQNIFKKWWSLFQAMLVMFPICGALGGASNLIRSMVLGASETHVWMLVVGMIAPYLPFFLLPVLLKNALSMLGKVGGAALAMGTMFRNGAKSGASAVQNTDRYKAAMQDSRLNTLRRRMGIDEKTGEFTERGRRKFQRAAKRGGASFRLANARLATVNKGLEQNKSDSAEYTRLMATAGINHAQDITGELFGTTNPNDAIFGNHGIGAYYGRQMIDAARAGDTESLDASIAAAKAGGMKDKDIAKILTHIFKTDAGGNSILRLGQDERAAYGRRLAAQHGNGILAHGGLELRHHLQTGSRINQASTLGTPGEYFRARFAAGDLTMGDFKEEDWVNADMNSIAAGAASGLLNADIAKRIMAKNPNIDSEKLVALGLIADGKADAGSITSVTPPAAGIGAAENFAAYAKNLANNRTASAGTAGSTSPLAGGQSANQNDVARYVKNRAQEVEFGENSVERQSLTSLDSRANQLVGEARNANQQLTDLNAAAELQLDVVDESNDQLKAVNRQLQQHSGSEVDHVRGLSDQDLDSLINDPNIPDNDPTKQAGHREHARRNSPPPPPPPPPLT